jgi:hypothetical protein
MDTTAFPRQPQPIAAILVACIAAEGLTQKPQPCGLSGPASGKIEPFAGFVVSPFEQAIRIERKRL